LDIARRGDSSCPSEAHRVKVQGWKGYSRGGHVFGKGTMSPSLPARGLGSAVTSPRDVQGQSPINLKFFFWHFTPVFLHCTNRETTISA